jgi:hypothetical protein
MASKSVEVKSLTMDQVRAMLKEQGISIEAEVDNSNDPIQEYRNCTVVHTATKKEIDYVISLIEVGCIVSVVRLDRSYGATKNEKKPMKGYGTTGGNKMFTIRNNKAKEDIRVGITVSSGSVKS